MNKTFLHDFHLKNNAKMVNFSGWEMPLNYGSQLDEHLKVRENVGMFDVSHMTVFEVFGKDAEEFLKKILSNDIAKIKTNGEAIYSLFLNEAGKILDDLIVYNLNEKYFIVSNCATKERDEEWLKKNAMAFEVKVEHKEDFGIIAIQGPHVSDFFEKNIGESIVNLKNFECASHKGLIFARTGYTGEDGFEIIGNKEALLELWNEFNDAGVDPIGLGARDTLRIEAGLCLYGTDMNDKTHPYECNLGWTVDMNDKERHFIGKKSLMKIDPKKSKKLVGVVLEDKGILRAGYKISDGKSNGEILSGTFSPVLKKSIGFARVASEFGSTGTVIIRNNALNVEIVSPRFIKKR